MDPRIGLGWLLEGSGALGQVSQVVVGFTPWSVIRSGRPLAPGANLPEHRTRSGAATREQVAAATRYLVGLPQTPRGMPTVARDHLVYFRVNGAELWAGHLGRREISALLALLGLPAAWPALRAAPPRPITPASYQAPITSRIPVTYRPR